LLDLRRANGVQEANVDLSAIDALRHSDRYLVTFRRMFHGDFTEFGTIGLRMGISLPPTTTAAPDSLVMTAISTRIEPSSIFWMRS
jgi:hypothetical protein